MKKLSRALGRIYDEWISPVGLNVTQQAILRCIDRRGGEPLVRIAEELEMDRTSLYRALTPMIRDHWVTTSEGKGSRFRTAKLTKTGRKALDAANLRWSELQEGLIQRFGKDSFEGLVAEIYRFAECAAQIDGPVPNGDVAHPRAHNAGKK